MLKLSVKTALALALALCGIEACGCNKSNDPASLPWDLTGNELKADAKAGAAEVDKAVNWVDSQLGNPPAK